MGLALWHVQCYVDGFDTEFGTKSVKFFLIRSTPSSRLSVTLISRALGILGPIADVVFTALKTVSQQKQAIGQNDQIPLSRRLLYNGMYMTYQIHEHLVLIVWSRRRLFYVSSGIYAKRASSTLTVLFRSIYLAMNVTVLAINFSVRRAWRLLKHTRLLFLLS